MRDEMLAETVSAKPLVRPCPRTVMIVLIHKALELNL